VKISKPRPAVVPICVIEFGDLISRYNSYWHV